jgi:membrane associated rhomboid family serine protease
MFLPYRVDVPYDRRPFANWLIVVALIAVFGLQLSIIVRQVTEWQTAEVQVDEEEGDEGQPDEEQITQKEDILGPIKEYVLSGWGIKGLFGHMWLHGGIGHLVGNLVFLWVFGNAVCAKVGNAVYLPAYIMFGLIAAVSHLIFIGGSMIGASGAINGVVGMFLVFFPENEISCLWLFFFPYFKRFRVSSYWMILMWFVFDILGAVFLTGQQGGVAYFAHLGGFASGAALAVIMLKTKWVGVERHEKSLLQLIGLEKSETEEHFRTDFEPWQQQYLVPDSARSEPETIPLESEKRREDFIRFVCSCGKRVKVPPAFAGRTGRCPKCNSPVKIPENPKT